MMWLRVHIGLLLTVGAIFMTTLCTARLAALLTRLIRTNDATVGGKAETKEYQESFGNDSFCKC